MVGEDDDDRDVGSYVAVRQSLRLTTSGLAPRGETT